VLGLCGGSSGDLPRAVRARRPGDAGRAAGLLHRHGGLRVRAWRGAAHGAVCGAAGSRAGAARGTLGRAGACGHLASGWLVQARGRTGARTWTPRAWRACWRRGWSQASARELALRIVIDGGPPLSTEPGLPRTAVLFVRTSRSRSADIFAGAPPPRVPRAGRAGPCLSDRLRRGSLPERTSCRALLGLSGPPGRWPWRSIADRGRAQQPGVGVDARGARRVRAARPPDAAQLGVDRASECMLLRAVAAAGLAPELVACEPATGLLVSGSSRAGPGRRRTSGGGEPAARGRAGPSPALTAGPAGVAEVSYGAAGPASGRRPARADLRRAPPAPRGEQTFALFGRTRAGVRPVPPRPASPEPAGRRPAVAGRLGIRRTGDPLFDVAGSWRSRARPGAHRYLRRGLGGLAPADAGLLVPRAGPSTFVQWLCTAAVPGRNRAWAEGPPGVWRNAVALR